MTVFGRDLLMVGDIMANCAAQESGTHCQTKECAMGISAFSEPDLAESSRHVPNFWKERLDIAHVRSARVRMEIGEYLFTQRQTNDATEDGRLHAWNRRLRRPKREKGADL